MKNDRKTPEIRFPEFTDDWEQRKLGDICEFINGDRSSNYPSATEFQESGIPFVGSDSLGATLVNKNKLRYISSEKYSHMNGLKIQSEDILYTLRGAGFGKCSISDFSAGTVASSLVGIRCKMDLLTPRFLVQWFYSSDAEEEKKKAVNGSTAQNISVEDMKSYVLRVPNVIEQKKIYEFLFDIDSLITLHQRKCDVLKNLKKGMLQKMFPKNGSKVPEIRFPGFTDDWEQRKLIDLVVDHNAGIYISKEDYGEGTNVIGVGNIYDNDIFDGEIYRLGPVNDEKFLLEENDIIYGESSLVPEGIARTVCVGKNGAGSAFAWHTRRVKLDNKIVNSHVATLELNYLNSVRKYLVSVSTQTALTGMTTEGYFGATLILPTIEEQQKISDYFKKIDNLITLHQRKYDSLKELKKGMLQKMFV